jgi:hypothetical protein
VGRDRRLRLQHRTSTRPPASPRGSTGPGASAVTSASTTARPAPTRGPGPSSWPRTAAGSSAAPPSSAWPWPATTRPTCRSPAGRGHLRLLDVRGDPRRRQRRPPRHLHRVRRPVAVSLCGGALGALSLHGFKPENAHPPGTPDERSCSSEGRDDLLRPLLLEALCAVDLPVGGHRRAGRGRRRRPVQHRQPHPARQGRPAGAQRAAARHDVQREHPPASASTPPPRCSGPSWPPAATRSTGSRPSRRSPPGPPVHPLQGDRCPPGR